MVDRSMVPPDDILCGVGPFEGKPELYLESGRQQVEEIQRLCALSPSDRVLDLGCGCGRQTIHLLDYIKPPGWYLGIDNDRKVIDWCRANLSARYDAFTFQWVDVHSKSYNPDGKVPPARLHLPLEDRSVSFVLCCSLFTHLLFEAVVHYFDEIRRVLVPGGTFVATNFLLNRRTLAAIADKKSYLDFRFPLGSSRAFDADGPERGIAHDEQDLMDLYHRNGFKVRIVKYGNWPEGSADDVQDMVVAVKRGGS